MDIEGFSFNVKSYCNKCMKFEPAVEKIIHRLPKGVSFDRKEFEQSSPSDRERVLNMYFEDRTVGCKYRGECDAIERFILNNQPQK